MKLRNKTAGLSLAVLAACMCLSGCGSKNAGTTVSVSIQSSVGTALILGQSTTLTATVTGATDTDANWVGCTYTTTTTNTSGTPTTSKAVACPSDKSLGSLSNETTTGTPTATFTAPATLPDPSKFPGLAIIITANAVANTSKTGSITLIILSGVTVSITPATVAVPIMEQQPFFAFLSNDLKNQGVTWAITQSIPTTASAAKGPNQFSSLPTCTVSGNATGCGSIDSKGVYTAPSAVPTVTVPANTTSQPTDSTTPAIATVIATSVEDPTQFAIATVTITTGGPITFNGITPTIAPQGATYWDIYVNAPGISSASQIKLTDANGGTTLLTSASGQVKVLFPIPTSSTPSPTSNGARIRLLAGNLQNAGPVTVSVTDPAEPVTTNTNGTFVFNIIPVRPTAVASSPTDILQGGIPSGTIGVTIDGGYFGPSGQLAQVTFAGNTIPGATNGAGQPISNSGQLRVQFPTGPINTGLPGLYSLTAGRAGLPLPNPNNPSVMNLSVFPSYATDPPTVVASVSAGTNPSAIDIDPVLGVAAVAETGANAVQFYTIGTGTLTPLGAPVPVGKVPTGLSVNRTNHTVAVVNYQDQSVTVLPIPGARVQAPGTPFTVNISGALQGAASPAPLPYAIGVDPDTNMALVAYSSTSTSSTSNLGFIVNLNTGANPFGCPLSAASPAPTGQCLFAQVTLNTGAFPQIAMAPHGHLAFVTPGGTGVVQGVDVTKASTSAAIQSLTLAASIVTVTTTAANGLVPGNAGTVLITGVPTTNSAGNTNFNGVFSVTVVSDTQFSYLLNGSANSGTVTIPSGTNAQVFYGNPNLVFGGVPTAQGIAINPVTNTAALSNSEATGANGAQINLLNNLDQSVSSVFFHSSCTFYTSMCQNAPELLGTTGVAWQPYSDLVVSYNPTLNQVSLSDPVTQNRFAFVCEASATKPNAAPPCLINPTTPAQQITYNAQIALVGTGTFSLPVQNGTTNTLTLQGGLAVDGPTNQAFVVMSGSGNIDIIDLGPCKQGTCANQSNQLKSAQISEVLVPSPNPGLGLIGGVPNASVPQGTLTSSTDLAGVQILGSGFDATTAVRLDGLALPAANVQFVSSRQLTVTIPASFLGLPHRYALDLVTGSGVQSNASDFLVIKAVDLTSVCSPTAPGTQHPSSVAIADQLVNGPFSPIAVVSISGCNAISTVDVNPTVTVNGQQQPNPNFGSILHTINVGASPQGLAVSQPFGFAVVANNGDGTASVVNLLTNTLAVPAIATGNSPTGVAINDATGAAIIANSGSSSISEINLALLTGSSPATSLSAITIGGFQQPTAVAIDPDRGTNNQGLAVVTALQLVAGAAPNGALQTVDIGTASPNISTTNPTGTVTAPATGIVFDPTVATGTARSGVFYASSSGGNVVTSFNPDSGAATPVNVGINPTALAINTETGAILTTNFGGQTTSIVDTHSSPLRSVRTIGLPGSGQFGVAIDPFTNLAVVVDQANNRLLIFAVPN